MDTNNKAKYVTLIEIIKNDIKEGRLKDGDKLPSENMLSEKYGMSRHTVRKAISILENEGYVTAEHGRGTFCTLKGRPKTSTKTVAVITTYISDYIFPSVINGVYDIMTKNGYNIILKNTKNSINIERKCLEDILGSEVDGAIIEPSKSQILCRNVDLYKRLDEAGITYVFIHGCYDQLKDKAHVVMDDELGAYMATEHLVRLNHKKIAGIFKADDSQGIKRHSGYARCLRENNIPYFHEAVIWYHTEDRKLKPQAALRELLENNGDISAVFCYNDQIAINVIKEINKMGLSVPGDISVVGFDNSPISEEIGLTTVNHPKGEIGKRAAELLLKNMRGENIHTWDIIPGELIVRNSTGRKE